MRVLKPESGASELLLVWGHPDLAAKANILHDPAGSIGAESAQFKWFVRSALDALMTPPALGARGVRLQTPFSVDATLLALALHYERMQRVGDNDGRDELVAATRDTVIPLVKYLGMWDHKRTLQDSLLRILVPSAYEELRIWTAAIQTEYFAFWQRLCMAIEEECNALGVAATVMPHYCHVEGAYRRLQLRSPTLIGLSAAKNAMRIEDLVTVQVTVGTRTECYMALAGAHKLGQPAPTSFRDLISAPRTNGFAGIVTKICLPDVEDGRPPRVVTVLIQTERMRDVGRLGIAQVDVRRTLSGAVRDDSRAAEYVQQLVSSVTTPGPHELKVFTRDRDVRLYPHAVTALDLAYDIHGELGDSAASAVIDGKAEDLSTVLTDGCWVNIIKAEDQTYQRTEKDLEYALLPRTRQKLLRSLFSEPQRRVRFRLIADLRRRGVVIDEKDLIGLASDLSVHLEYASTDELYAAISAGRRTLAEISTLIKERVDRVGAGRAPNYGSPLLDWAPVPIDRGSTQLQTVRAICHTCSPSPADPIVGLRTLRGITAHRADCRLLGKRERLQLDWVQQPRIVRANLGIQARDRALLVHSITNAIHQANCGLEEISARSESFGQAHVDLHVYTNSGVSLVELMESLNHVRSVTRVSLVGSSLPPTIKTKIQQATSRPALLHELEDLGYGRSRKRLSPPSVGGHLADLVLEYSEQRPTWSPELFFGRRLEVSTVLEHTVGSPKRPDPTRSGTILLWGHKRSGKTSLGLRFLDAWQAVELPLRPALIHCDFRIHTRSPLPTLLNYICKAVNAQMGLAIQPECDITGMLTFFKQVSRMLEGRRLVLFFDEAGGLIESHNKGILDGSFFQLVDVVMDRSDLPISVVYAMPPTAQRMARDCAIFGGLARPLKEIEISPLLRSDARDMVMSQLQSNQLRISENAMRELLNLTASQPYFIVLMLKALFTSLASRPHISELTSSEIKRARDTVARQGTDFIHYLREAGTQDLGETCLRGIARCGKTWDRFIPLEQIQEEVQNKAVATPRDVRKALDFLCTLSLVKKYSLPPARRAKAVPPSYQIGLPLLHKYLRLDES